MNSKEEHAACPLLAVIIFASLTAAAAAQTPNPLQNPTGMPTTMPLINNITKERIGTATLWGGRMVLRKTDGTFIATVVVERDGTRKMFDESGKTLDQIPSHIVVPKSD
jgi:bifunctional DNase/RNase